VSRWSGGYYRYGGAAVPLHVEHIVTLHMRNGVRINAKILRRINRDSPHAEWRLNLGRNIQVEIGDTSTPRKELLFRNPRTVSR
jgi:hypothetical protein